MFYPGFYCYKLNVLVIKEMSWEDLKNNVIKKQTFSKKYDWVYEEEKEDFEFKSITHVLWCVLTSSGKLEYIWEKRK